jgi:hypothetical protein
MDDNVATGARDLVDVRREDEALEAFADWFCAYWRARGAELFRDRLESDAEDDDA